MEPPAVISLPLSTFENMTMEMNWRFQEIINGIWEKQDDLKDYLRTLNVDDSPKPFDPLRTIGKY